MIRTILNCMLFVVLLTSARLAFATNDALTSGGFQYSITPVPSWVSAQPVPEPQMELSQGSQYLLSDEQLNVTNGQYDSFSRVAQKVTTEQSLEQASKISMQFNPEFQAFALHKILVKRGETTLDLTHTSKIELFQREEQVNNNIYDGKVTVFIVIPDIRVGDIVEYASTTFGKNPVFGDNIFASFSLGWGVAVQSSYMRLVTDIKRPLDYRVHKHSGAPVVNKTATTIEYTWAQKDNLAILDEQGYPAGFTPYPFIEFSEFKSWQSVVDWALIHYKQQDSASKILQQYVNELKATTTDKFEYIEAAIKFVQNDVRYFGIETGQNSHIPSKPGEVFERRYGDCKDKTMLLNYLLTEQGIEAYPALISMQSRGTIADNLPSPGHFDHVISYFIVDGKEYWIDGTRTFQLGKLDNIGVSSFEQALVIRPNQKSLTELKTQFKHRSQTHVHETFAATGNYEDDVNLTMSIRFHSHEAEYLRGALAAQSIAEFTRHYLDFYSKHFPGISVVEDIKVADDTSNNIVELTGTFKIREFWHIENNRVTTPLYGEFLSSYAQLPSTIQRKFPLGLYHRTEVSQQVDIIFPETVEWSFENNPLTIENESIKYVRNITFDQKRLSVNHHYSTKQKAMSPAMVAGYVRDVKKIRDAIYLSVYNGKNASTSIRSVLRNLLNRKLSEQTSVEQNNPD